MASNGEVERPPRGARSAPRAHTVFERPRRSTAYRSRPAPTIVRHANCPADLKTTDAAAVQESLCTGMRRQISGCKSRPAISTGAQHLERRLCHFATTANKADVQPT